MGETALAVGIAAQNRFLVVPNGIGLLVGIATVIVALRLRPGHTSAS